MTSVAEAEVLLSAKLVFAAPQKQGHKRTLRDRESNELIGAAFTGEPTSCFALDSVRNPVDFTWAMRAVRGNQRRQVVHCADLVRFQRATFAVRP